jgi:phage shock protein A
MVLLKRISTLIAANLNHLMDKSENPEVMIKQVIREMEEGIIELRRETAKAIANEKLLEKKIHETQLRIKDLDIKAQQLLEKNEEDLATKTISKKLEIQNDLTYFQQELKHAKELSQKMKQDLAKLEDKVQLARRKKSELIRRKRETDAQMKTHSLRQKTEDALNSFEQAMNDVSVQESDLSSYEQKILESESEAQALEEMLDSDEQKLLEIEKHAKSQAVKEELEKLKKKMKKK